MADGQSQTCAAVLPCGGHVRLFERLEKRFEFVLCDSDAGVAHREVQQQVAVLLRFRFNTDDDLAGCRELDGVAEQVGQHLPQSTGVTLQHVGNRRINKAGQFQIFPLRPQCLSPHGVAHRVVQPEVDLLKLQHAGFDFGEVQNVVDYRQQRFGRIDDRAEIVTLNVVEIGFEHEFRQPHDGIHGRANFVAHVGEELVLGLVGFLQFLGQRDGGPTLFFKLYGLFVEFRGPAFQVGRSLFQLLIDVLQLERGSDHVGDVRELVEIGLREVACILIARLQHAQEPTVPAQDRNGQPASHHRMFQAAVIFQVAEILPLWMRLQFLVRHQDGPAALNNHTPDALACGHDVVRVVLVVLFGKRMRVHGLLEVTVGHIADGHLVGLHGKPGLLRQLVERFLERARSIRLHPRAIQMDHRGPCRWVVDVAVLVHARRIPSGSFIVSPNMLSR